MLKSITDTLHAFELLQSLNIHFAGTKPSDAKLHGIASYLVHPIPSKYHFTNSFVLLVFDSEFLHYAKMMQAASGVLNTQNPHSQLRTRVFFVQFSDVAKVVIINKLI